MTNAELIGKLCSVVERQSRIIREQAYYIDQTNDDTAKIKFAEMRKTVDDELDALEYQMRPYRFNCGEE